jgi:peroxiredoxin
LIGILSQSNASCRSSASQIQARQIDTIEVKSVVDVFVNAAGRIQDDIDKFYQKDMFAFSCEGRSVGELN